MNVKAMHFSRQHASSFTTIASKLAPTGVCVYRVRVNRLTSAPGNNAEAVARWL